MFKWGLMHFVKESKHSELLEKRFKVYQDHILESDELFDEKWLRGDFFRNSDEYFSFICKEIVDSLLDWDNKKVFDQYNLKFLVAYDLYGIQAQIKVYNSYSLQITFSIDFILWVEINAVDFCRNQKVSDRVNEIEISNFFKTLNSDLSIKNLNTEEVDRIVNFFSDCNYDNHWSVFSYYSILWVVYHEFGHFLFGHSGFFESLQYEQLLINIDFEENKSMSQTYIWTSELSADIYANFRVSWHLANDYKKKYLTIINDSRFDMPLCILINCPAIVFSAISRIAFTDEYYYPNLKTRMLNVYSNILFVYYPTFHQYWDYRKIFLIE